MEIKYKYISGIPCACCKCGKHLIQGKYSTYRGWYYCTDCREPEPLPNYNRKTIA